MKNVTIYSTPTCIHCEHAKHFFKDNEIPYTEHNVLSDLEKRMEMVEKSGQMGVPVIAIDDDIVIGFDEAHIKELLEIK
ncbi:MAG TPA: glutaredoxin family protein [Candidatus Paceibacterota bacterium]|jgi:glutaredoxin-like YruB-family protein|nr:glutaredoxin family protein [Candidatus Paceibacterota bacterium]